MSIDLGQSSIYQQICDAGAELANLHNGQEDRDE
jgi:hypothetical protein